MALVATSLSGGERQAGRVSHGPNPSVVEVPLGDGALHLIADVHDVGDNGSLTPGSGTVAGLVRSETAFGLALTSQLAAQAHGGNVVDSPLSADLALSMLELGATGSTETGIAQALQTGTLSPSAQAAAWADLQAALASPDGAAMEVANSAWLQEGDSFVPAYLDELARAYGNDAYLADLARRPAQAAAAINAWVSDHTGGRIRQLLSPDDLGAYTVFVLLNALNFSASWAPDINMSKATETFTADDGSASSVPAIENDSQGLALPAAVTAAYTAVEIPYAGGRYQAIVIEPAAGTISQLIQHLDTSRLDAVLASLRSEQVALTMPALNLAVTQNLDSVLSNLGMDQAFGPAADLSGISPQAGQVALVEQADDLTVNQTGTKFSAATGIVGVATAVQCCIRQVTIDRPYLFLLQDKTTGLILADSVIAQP
jgi:serpin B